MSKKPQASATAAAEQIVMLPLRQLRESPFNPRKNFNQAALEDLAASMRAPHGRIHSPLVVRPLAQADVEATHEIVFGHRRHRAAALAELDEVPVVIRDMTDEEVRVAQLIENAQREDVSPLEEADAIAALRKEHGYSIEQLMERFGKKRRYVFATLKLATAHDDVRQALADGVIGSEIAKLLATVPKLLQPEALEQVTVDHHEDGESTKRALSYREAKGVIEDDFRLKLADAPFSTTTLYLSHVDAPICTQCPKNSSNEPALEEDCGAGVCTDTECFSAKRTAATEQKLREAMRSGHNVVMRPEAERLIPDRHMDWVIGHVRLAACAQAYERAKAEGKAPPLVVLEHPHRPGVILELVTIAAYHQLQADAGDPEQRAGQDEAPASAATAQREYREPEWLVKQRERYAECAAEEARRSPEERAVWGPEWHDIKRAVMRRALHAPRSLYDLQLMALNELEWAGDFGSVEELLGWQEPADADGERDWLRDRVLAASPGELGTLLALVAIDREDFMSFDDPREARLALCRHYGVDPLNPDAASPPSTAARGDDGAAAEADTESEAAPAPAKAAKTSKAKRAAAVRAALDLVAPCGGDEQDNDAGCAGGSTAHVDALEEA